MTAVTVADSRGGRTLAVQGILTAQVIPRGKTRPVLRKGERGRIVRTYEPHGPLGLLGIRRKTFTDLLAFGAGGLTDFLPADSFREQFLPLFLRLQPTGLTHRLHRITLGSKNDTETVAATAVKVNEKVTVRDRVRKNDFTIVQRKDTVSERRIRSHHHPHRLTHAPLLRLKSDILTFDKRMILPKDLNVGVLGSGDGSIHRTAVLAKRLSHQCGISTHHRMEGSTTDRDSRLIDIKHNRNGELRLRIHKGEDIGLIHVPLLTAFGQQRDLALGAVPKERRAGKQSAGSKHGLLLLTGAVIHDVNHRKTLARGERSQGEEIAVITVVGGTETDDRVSIKSPRGNLVQSLRVTERSRILCAHKHRITSTEISDKNRREILVGRLCGRLVFPRSQISRLKLIIVTHPTMLANVPLHKTRSTETDTLAKRGGGTRHEFHFRSFGNSGKNIVKAGSELLIVKVNLLAGFRRNDILLRTTHRLIAVLVLEGLQTPACRRLTTGLTSTDDIGADHKDTDSIRAGFDAETLGIILGLQSQRTNDAVLGRIEEKLRVIDITRKHMGRRRRLVRVIDATTKRAIRNEHRTRHNRQTLQFGIVTDFITHPGELATEICNGGLPLTGAHLTVQKTTIGQVTEQRLPVQFPAKGLLIEHRRLRRRIHENRIRIRRAERAVELMERNVVGGLTGRVAGRTVTARIETETDRLVRIGMDEPHLLVLLERLDTGAIRTDGDEVRDNLVLADRHVLQFAFPQVLKVRLPDIHQEPTEGIVAFGFRNLLAVIDTDTVRAALRLRRSELSRPEQSTLTERKEFRGEVGLFLQDVHRITAIETQGVRLIVHPQLKEDRILHDDVRLSEFKLHS